MKQIPVKIVEVLSEIGGARRGASLGPEAIKLAARNTGSFFFNEYEVLCLPHRNKGLLSSENKINFCDSARWITYILENCQTICNSLSDVLETGHFPLVLSGDHSSAAGLIAGIKQAYPNERLGVIWIDAHSDLHSPYTTYSGNMHGMPLGASLALDGGARILLNKPINQLPDPVRRQWRQLKELGGMVPKIVAEDLVLIGARYFKEEHTKIIESLGIRLETVGHVRRKGMDAFLHSIDAYLENCNRIFISFDVDSLDCDLVSRGTGTPEPNGLYVEEVIAMVRHFMANPKTCCLEVTEVNPILDDKGNAMAEAAWQVIDEAIAAYKNRLEI